MENIVMAGILLIAGCATSPPEISKARAITAALAVLPGENDSVPMDGDFLIWVNRKSGKAELAPGP